MECISELKDSLNVYFGWNKARMACFVNMLLALLATRTVNLNKLACVVFGDALQSSRYRRIQRFFSKFPLDYQQIAGFIFKLFFVSDGQWYLSMDRTNWRWGKSDINILMLGIVFKGTAIPIYWMLLDKRGNSDTQERIALIQMFIDHFGKNCIKGILADREFVGKDWFGWLLKERIPFYIRIKKLVALLAIAFTWAHRTGEWQNEHKPIKIKKHGRPAVSLFRYGLDFLCDSIVRLAYKTNHFQQALKILNSMPSLACS
jgi:predicted DNA-binding transcriptional regulator